MNLIKCEWNENELSFSLDLYFIIISLDSLFFLTFNCASFLFYIIINQLPKHGGLAWLKERFRDKLFLTLIFSGF